jgi:IclR family transcriptional regulator, KDG regulon repressor
MGNQSVERALTIISLFSRQKTKLGITEIADVLGITKGATHSIVSTLVRAGFLSQDPDTKKYKLGLKMFEIGMLQPQIQHLNQAAMGPAIDLSHACKVITRVSIWDGDAVLVTWTTYPSNRPELSASVGPRLHAHATAMGKSMLAHMPPDALDSFLANNPLTRFTNTTITDEDQFRKEMEAVVQRGYAVDREESLLGNACIGTPVFDGNLSVLGAVSISGSPKMILPEDRIHKLARDLLICADTVSRSLGYPPFGRTGARKP